MRSRLWSTIRVGVGIGGSCLQRTSQNFDKRTKQSLFAGNQNACDKMYIIDVKINGL